MDIDRGLTGNSAEFTVGSATYSGKAVASRCKDQKGESSSCKTRENKKEGKCLVERSNWRIGVHYWPEFFPCAGRAPMYSELPFEKCGPCQLIRENSIPATEW